MDVLADFVFLYPLVMATTWMVGGLYYYLRRERGMPPVEQPPPLTHSPLVSILVPCHNEGANARETVQAALEQRYPHVEVVAVNDGSTDDTAAVLDALAAEDPRVRVVHLDSNQGKAVALRMGAMAARSEYLVCVDGDALLDEYAAHWMVWHLLSGPRVGAVTGNPRVRNRSTLLGRLQVGEFSSIVGLIKRAQRTYGRVFTVSGVICAFRRTALHRVGYWNETAQTEDIDISWRLQMDHWDVRYEPRALCSMLMPETLRGLWRQRLRWARGGAQVVLRHGGALLSWRRRRMWPVLVETLVSATWAVSLAVLTIALGVGMLLPTPEWAQPHISVVPPGWESVVLASVCMLQFAISMGIDSRYESGTGTGRYYYWMIWYPVAFWLLGMLALLAAIPSVLTQRRGGVRAVWAGSDRGFR